MDFSVRRTLGLMGQTLPFIVFRSSSMPASPWPMCWSPASGPASAGAWAPSATPTSRPPAPPGRHHRLRLTAGALYFLREYLLYLVKAGHIAVLVELLDGRGVPQGQGQIGYATSIVRERFAETSVLFGVDQLVTGVLAAILGLLQGITALLPVPGLQNVVGLARAFLRIAVGLMDEVILGYLIRTGAENPWAGAQQGLVLYAQNYKVMLRNAAWLTVIVYGLGFVVFLLMLAPAAALVWLVPNAWGAGGVVFALIFAWAVKAALLEPFATPP